MNESVAVMIPAAARDDVVDTVRSVRSWMPSAPVLVINDSERSLIELRPDPNVHVLPTLPYARNAFGGLWAKLCYGLRWLLANTDCGLILRLDADAVVLRPGLESPASTRFSEDPKMGLLGGHRVGYDGSMRDFRPAARPIRRASGWLGYSQPGVRLALRRLLTQAATNGYQTGDHAIGCALLLRRTMVEEWDRQGWLDPGPLARSQLADDFLLAICAHAAGYSIGEGGGPGGIFAVKWRGLPASPEAIADSPAFVTHSVRAYDGYDEAGIRRYFASRRPATQLHHEFDIYGG
jgi:hypothetical protein